MWCRICSLLLLLCAACSDGVTVDVCGRGDEADLATAMAGGQLELEFHDQSGATVTTLTAPFDHASNLSAVSSDDVRTITVTGRNSDGDVVATGEATLAGDGTTCVCLALSAQQKAACSGLACRLSGGQCSFYDAQTGAPAGTRTLLLGENDRDDVHDVTADTYLVDDSAHVADNYGAEKTLVMGTSPSRVGLLRFNLVALPKSAVIDQATLTLQVASDGGAPALLYRVLEKWGEGDKSAESGCASWTCRTGSTDWTVAGCGYTDSEHRSREAAVVATLPASSGSHSIDVTATVAAWVAAPSANFGFALMVNSTNTMSVASHEATSTTSRPELTVQYHLP